MPPPLRATRMALKIELSLTIQHARINYEDLEARARSLSTGTSASVWLSETGPGRYGSGIDLISKQALQRAAGTCRKSIAGGIADVKGCGRQDPAESRNFLPLTKVRRGPRRAPARSRARSD
jgi:hypothetical protein